MEKLNMNILLLEMFNSACITRYSWFVEMSRLRNELMEIIKINWVPEHIKEGRFGEWLKEARIGQFRATVIGERLCLFGNAGTRIAFRLRALATRKRHTNEEGMREYGSDRQFR